MDDIRLITSYESPNDSKFIGDTIWMRLKGHEVDFDEDTLDRLNEFRSVLEENSWQFSYEMAHSAASLIVAGNLTFRRVFAICRVLNCDLRTSRSGDSQPELNYSKLLNQMNQYFAGEWQKVSEGKNCYSIYIVIKNWVCAQISFCLRIQPGKI
jgi:hypothetical protein